MRSPSEIAASVANQIANTIDPMCESSLDLGGVIESIAKAIEEDRRERGDVNVLANDLRTIDGMHKLHPDDDETSIDAAWLGSVGFSERHDTLRNEKAFVVTDKVTSGVVMGLASACAGPKCWDWHTLTVTAAIPIPTRGDVRRLAAVLGIPLKETEEKA